MARGQSNRPARKWFANTCVAIVSNNRRRKLAVVKYQTSLMWSARVCRNRTKMGFIWLGFPFVRILRNQRRAKKSTLKLTKTRKNKRDFAIAIRILHGNLLKFYSSCLILSTPLPSPKTLGTYLPAPATR